MMPNSINLRFHDLIRKRIQERVETRRDQIASGQPKAWEQYREGVGYLRALTDVLKDAEEIRIDLVEER